MALLQPASVLAQLICHGLAAELPEALPPGWQAAYNAVRRIPASNYVERWRAFAESIAAHPARAQMERDLQQAVAALAEEQLGQLRVYSAWESLEAPPVTRHSVAGLFARPSLNLIVGAPGSKKTWLALDLAVSVASGQPWLGHKTSAVPVLLVDEEGGVQRTWDRLARVMRGHRAPRRTPVYFIPPSGYDFARQDSADALVNRARSLAVGFIIIDALLNVMPGTDENNVLSLQPVLANLRRLARRAAATVLVIHHTNKQGVFRGSTSLSSGVDHMLVVESSPHEDRIQLATFKARDIEPVSLIARAHFQPRSFHLSLLSNTLPASLGRSARALLDTLAELQEATSAQLSSAHRTSTRTRGLIHELTRAGCIQRANPGQQGKPARYTLTSHGRSLLALELKTNE